MCCNCIDLRAICPVGIDSGRTVLIERRVQSMNTGELDYVTLHNEVEIKPRNARFRVQLRDRLSPERHVRRRVRNARLTGHKAYMWGDMAKDEPLYQWEGVILFARKTIKVWGYSRFTDVYPIEWANDTY